MAPPPNEGNAVPRARKALRMYLGAGLRRQSLELAAASRAKTRQTRKQLANSNRLIEKGERLILRRAARRRPVQRD